MRVIRTTTITLADGARLDATNAHRIAEKLSVAVGEDDQDFYRGDHWSSLPPLPGKRGKGAERFARDFVRMMGDRVLAHSYDRDLALLRTLDLTSPSIGAHQGCASLVLHVIPCCAASIWLRSTTGLLVLENHAVARGLERLAIAGPRAALRGVTYRWLPLLHRIAHPGADVVLPLAGGRRPGLLRSEWNRSRTLVGKTVIAPKPGSGVERLHAELVQLLDPPPKFGTRPSATSTWLAALGFSS